MVLKQCRTEAGLAQHSGVCRSKFTVSRRPSRIIRPQATINLVYLPLTIAASSSSPPPDGVGDLKPRRALLESPILCLKVICEGDTSLRSKTPHRASGSRSPRDRIHGIKRETPSTRSISVGTCRDTPSGKSIRPSNPEFHSEDLTAKTYSERRGGRC